MTVNYKKGIFFALLTALISGFSIYYNKLVIAKGVDPLILNILKNGGVAIILSLILLSLPSRRQLLSLSSSSWKKLFLIGLIGGSIPFVLYFEGLRLVTATNANLIHKSMFIWVTIMAIPILGERLNLWQIIGYLLVAWSNLFLGGFAGFTGTRGEILIFAATLFWSVEYIIAKITLKTVDNNVVAWGRMFIGVIILIAFALGQHKLSLLTLLTPNQLLLTSGSVLFLSGYVLTWYKALKLAPATLVTSVLIISTPITNILTVIFITHVFPQVQLVNAAATLIGVILISFCLKAPKKSLVNLPVK